MIKRPPMAEDGITLLSPRGRLTHPVGLRLVIPRYLVDHRKHEPTPLAGVARILPSVVVAGPNVAATAPRAGSDRGVRRRLFDPQGIRFASKTFPTGKQKRTHACGRV